MDSIGGSVASSLISREPARAVVSTIPLALHGPAVGSKAAAAAIDLTRTLSRDKLPSMKCP